MLCMRERQDQVNKTFRRRVLKQGFETLSQTDCKNGRRNKQMEKLEAKAIFYFI